MTLLTIELSDEQKAVLSAKALARGLSTEQYALKVKVLEHDLVPEWLQKSWGTASFNRMTSCNGIVSDAQVPCNDCHESGRIA